MKKLRTLAIVLIATLLISCASNQQQSSVEASKIGFTEEMDSPSERQILRISPEQSNIIRRFCLSPDENELVFSGVQSGGSDNVVQLWKISNYNLTSPIKITSGGINNRYSPSYTNDGRYIIYESSGQIWKVKKDGSGGKIKIPGSGTNNDYAPQVSSRNMLVFHSLQRINTNIKYIIWKCDLSGGELTHLREGRYPYWSPNGKRIVFEHKNEIWVIDSDGTNLMQLTNTPDINEGLPTFSYDGEMIAYASNEDIDGEPMNDYNIWIMNADGSEKQQMTALNSWDSWPILESDGIYFLSGRAQKKDENVQRIWKLKLRN